jgi:hypothetical protein
MCPRVTFARPRCGHMESTSVTHALRVTTQYRGLQLRAVSDPRNPIDSAAAEA